MRGKYKKRFTLFVLMAAMGHLHAAETAALPQIQETIAPKHVFALAHYVNDEIESLRFAMGRPTVSRNIVHVDKAAPREVYFQALSLLEKLNRLYFELSYEKVPPIKPEKYASLSPESVWRALETCVLRLRAIKKRYRIKSSGVFPQVQEGKRPSDVYMALLQASRQTNELLSQPYLPADVFQQLTTSLYYTFSLQQSLSDFQLLVEPVHVPGKQPADVYEEMLQMYSTVRGILETKGIRVLELKVLERKDIRPTDVYDIVVLVNSQLVYLHATVPNSTAVNAAIYPGVRFPSHVFQRAKFLHAHLKQLHASLKTGS